MALRCLIVDDSVHFLDAARSVLDGDSVHIVGAAGSVRDALDQVRALRPDVVLADIDLGSESGFDLARRLGGTPPVILISAHPEPDFADMVAESPAVGFIAKTSLSGRAVRELLGAPPPGG